MEVENVYLEYLRSVNPIAQRIAEDLENIQNANQDKWRTMDEKSKMKLIDDSLIDGELVLKYQDEADEDLALEPISTFSWFTKSQLNLFTTIDTKPVNNRIPMKKFDLLSPVKKGKDTTDGKDLSIVNRIKLKVMRSPPPDDQHEQKQHSKTLPKPKMPPPPPPPKRLSHNEVGQPLSGSTSQDDIPKTGFDFLDNW